MNTSSQSTEKDVKHDTYAHIAAGGFGSRADGCPACEYAAENDTRAPRHPIFPRLPGTRFVCCLFGHVWAPEWWARGQYDRPSACLRCRVFPPGKNLQDDHLKGGA